MVIAAVAAGFDVFEVPADGVGPNYADALLGSNAEGKRLGSEARRFRC